MTDAKIILPEKLKPLFWSYSFEYLNTEKDKKLIVVQVINYGLWEDWKWLVAVYGKAELRRIIASLLATEFRPPALLLISLLLGIKETNHALRGSR